MSFHASSTCGLPYPFPEGATTEGPSCPPVIPSSHVKERAHTRLGMLHVIRISRVFRYLSRTASNPAVLDSILPHQCPLSRVIDISSGEKMRFSTKAAYILTFASTIYRPALSFPARIPIPSAVGTRHARTLSMSMPRPRQWHNGSQIPSDPQIFCRNDSEAPIFTTGDEDLGGPGVLIWNYDPNEHGGVNGTMFFLYESNHDFVPYKYTIIPPWSCVYIAVCSTFRGRVVRGDSANLDGQKHLLGTWAENNWHANRTGSTWGDISLLQGNDGAAIIQSLDGNSRVKGFTLDLLSNAPDKAWAQKATGSWCLDKIIGEDANTATRDWETQFLDPWSVYLEDDIDPVINSDNGRFQVTFYEGII
ncbi:hypothetical protein F4677DRAFT_326007 [Hypoxylon crocopeplum]|nr:hypothetical protein F4677DRAFT_326007 [Hypoxylon crocopeplum]